MEDYVQWEVLNMRAGFTEETGFAMNFTKVPIHQCNESDEFYEGHPDQKFYIQSLKPFIKCLDHPEDLKLWGNSNT